MGVGANDRKRFISRVNNPAFVEEMARRTEAGDIVPFGVLFPETVCEYLDDSEKADAEIVQIGFLVTNRRGEVFLTRRAKFSEHATSGHSVTIGESVLVSSSPVDGDSRRHPDNDAALRKIYGIEIDDSHAGDAGAPLTPEFHFLGLVRSDVRGPRYYFYLYEARYDHDAPLLGRVRGRENQRRLLKDRADELLNFVAVDESLKHRLVGAQVDLAALALFRREAPAAWCADPRVVVVAGTRDEPPPHLDGVPDAFISHATADDEMADAIAAALKTAGMTVWLDHATLSVGQRWFREIEQAVRYARCFVLICSANSVASQGVADEVELCAQARERWGDAYPVFPVVIAGARREEFLPVAFSGNANGVHVQDLRDPAGRAAGLKELVVAIQREKA